MLLAKVFGREDFVSAAVFKQKAAAGDSGFGSAVVVAMSRL
jgi:hypothetical protein